MEPRVEAFGDIVRYGEGGAAELVAQVAGLGEEAVASQRIDTGGKVHGGFPARQVFEAFVFHAANILFLVSISTSRGLPSVFKAARPPACTTSGV